MRFLFTSLLLGLFYNQSYGIFDTSLYQVNPSLIRHNTWVLKGKLLPWIALVIPMEGINYTIGLEYGFKDRNSVGMDCIYNDNNTHHDYPINNGDSVGPPAYSVSRSIIFSYRRYFEPGKTFLYRPVSWLLKDDFQPYYSIFARYGKQDYHFAKGFYTNILSYDEWQYSVGLLYGVLYSFVDVNFGFFYKQTYISENDLDNGISVLHNHMKPIFGFRLGLNFQLVLRRNTAHFIGKYAY